MVNRHVVLVDAHRGASASHPENTLGAFRAALAAGADSVEFDVRLSADDEPVVIHDEEVDRTTDGVGEVAALSLAELRSLDAGAWKGDGFAGERVPTLAETLDVLASAPRINMELKTSNTRVVEVAVREIERRRLHHRVMVSSFHLPHLISVKRRLPGVWTHLFLEEPLPEEFWNGDGRFVNSLGIPFKHVTAEVVAGLRERGRAAWTFTVDDPGMALDLAAAGVAAVTTNRPEQMLRLFEETGYR